MSISQAGLDLLAEFELGLDPRRPERSRIPARVLGYGEISTVLEIDADGVRDQAFKRLPSFVSRPEIEAYTSAFVEYNRLLEQDIGLRLAGSDYAHVVGVSGKPVFYIVQERFPADSIGNRAVDELSREGAVNLVKRILTELRKVWDFNKRQNRVRVAIDGQISNWALDGEALRYLDTSTPLFRIDGIEQLDTELFLRSAPSFLVWILRLFFLRDVVDRYYDFHRVSVDLVANFHKEQKSDLVPGMVLTVNDFFAGEAKDLEVAPISEKEVSDYYKEDAFIWSLYFSMRKIDRFLRLRVLRGEYPYILPDKIAR